MCEEEFEIMDKLKAKEAELDLKLTEASSQTERSQLIRGYIKSVVRELPDRPSIEFPSNWDWPNLESEPLTLEDHLKGRVTLLDFFTYCCINCMHLLPDLEALENEFSPTDLLIVGVHSPKFENEKISKNIGNAASRYNIHHPVLNDPQATLWKRLEIICWPTVLVLDPSGKPIKFFIGEGKRELMQEFLRAAFESFRELGMLTATVDSIPTLRTEQDCVDGRTKISKFLKFPQKIASDCTGRLLFIADSGHHRIVVLNLATRRVECIIGDGVKGFKDGEFKTARFSTPQGLCFREPDELYICDTGNHALRLLKLDTGLVSTLAGNGSRGNDLEGGKLGPEQNLSSPWDVCLGCSPGMMKSTEIAKTHDVAFIAMAGSHQIWAFAFDDVTWWKGQTFSAKTCFRVAGNGAEENRNTSYPTKAAFAQPSGLSFDLASGLLFIADSESSSIRSLNLQDNGTVKGVVGASKNPLDLFSFGDADGKGCDAKLQHPMAVVTCRNESDEGAELTVLVADSYNHKLKLVSDLGAKNPQCKTLQLNGPEASLNEPAGLALSHDGSTLYLCDTNNHCIKLVDMKTLTVEILEIDESLSTTNFDDNLKNEANQIKIYVNNSGGDFTLKLSITLQQGAKLNPEAPSSWSLVLPSSGWSTSTDKSSGEVSSTELYVKLIHSIIQEGAVEPIVLKLNLFLCNSDTGLCSVARRVFSLNAEAVSSADKSQTREISVNI